MGSKLSNRTKFFISSAAAAAAVDTASEYAALTWTEIESVYDLGEFGDLHEGVEDVLMSESRVKRLKGTVDAGTMELVVSVNSDDPGQETLAAARKADGDYAFKIVLPDKKTSNGAGTTYYFRGAVLGGRTAFGETNNVVRATWSIAINSDQLEVAAS